MKTRTIVLGLALLAVIGLAGAITWDQFRMMKADQVRTGNKLKAVQAELKDTKAALRKSQQEKLEWMTSAVDMAKKAQDLIDAQKRVEDATSVKMRLLEAKANAVEAVPTRGGSAGVSTYGSAAVTPAKVSYPRWIPEAQVVVDRKIKERATKEHGNDFSAAKYEIERQTEAYAKLVRYQRMNNPTVTELLAKTAFEKGEDYTGMVWEIERQLDAAKVIQGR
jgi:hypothetical protein